MRDLEYQAKHSLTEYARSRTCSLGGAGTGNVLRVRHGTFIVTAKHVADAFFKLKRPRVICHHNHKVLADRLEYVSNTDDDIDIALLAVHDLSREVVSYDYDDFEFIDDFRTHSFEKVNLQLCGFPKELQQETETSLFYTWMCYTTIPCTKPSATKNFLFCQYPMNAPAKESRSGDNVRLPGAPGLSGAFLLKIQADGRGPQIWSPTTAKVIAVQIAWKKNAYVKCSNITHLKSLLRRATTTGRGTK